MTDFTYVIERFDVSGEEEVLIERAELVREGDALVCLVQGSGERTLDVADVPSAIAGDQELSEVRANQITRITASDAVYDELPFILRVPGDPDDFDATLWSEDMIEEHTTNEGLDRKVSRVAYVNGQRWCAYPTLAGGSRMLIADEYEPGVPEVQDWATLTIADSDLRQEDSFQIGPMTQLAMVATHVRSIAETKPLTLWRRAADPAGDAAKIVDWLLDCVPEQLGFKDEAHRQMLAQLLVEVAVRQIEDEDIPARYLAAGHRDQPVDVGDAIWNLGLHVPGVTGALLAELVAQRGPAMAAIAMAATNPESTEGRSRRAAVEALGEWGLKLSEPEPIEYADLEDDEVDEDDLEDDPDAPWNRDPVDSLPAVIEPGQIAIEFWEKDSFSGEHVLYDFIFYWDGERKADWFYDISMKNPGLSPMSSAPIGGTATWENGADVYVTIQSNEFDLDEAVTFAGHAPKDDSTQVPQTWVTLGRAIAGTADGYIE